MSFATQSIKYGWVALASLGVLTGTTIYVANNQRHQVKPQDIIEIALGTYERCLATQTSTNPTYSVTPPSFVRTWTSNVYTTNGVTVHTNIVTNTIGWHIDLDMMASLDTTIKALIPHYVDPNTVYDGTTNIVMLTVTGLWASLGIGDKTNQFTRTPAWTNPVSTNWIVNYTSYWPSTNGTATNVCYTADVRQAVNYAQSWTATGGHVWVTSSNWDSQVVQTTNVATYGYYPWQIYVEDLQERYKVLNALKMTKGTRTRSYNGSDADQSDWTRGIYDLFGYEYSNSVSGVLSPIAYSPFLGAEILGLNNMFFYSSYYSNNVPVNNWSRYPPYSENTHRLTYSEYQQYHNYWYFHQWTYQNPERPPWTPYPDGYLQTTNETGLGAGSYFAITKEPYSSTLYFPPAPDPKTTERWRWVEYCRATYSTWEFYGTYPNQQIANTYALYLKPTLPSMPIEDAVDEYWQYPASWDITVDGKFEELAGMPTNVYSKLDESFIQNTNGVLTIEFGSDEFGALQTASTHPDYPAAPTEATAAENYYNNAGSVGTMKGSYVNPEDYCFVKTWQFACCTNKYW